MKEKHKQLTSLVVLLVIFLVTDAANAELIAHWKLDETSGNTAEDSSGNGNSGILYGDPVWSTGKINGALEFDGRNDYVELPIGSVINSLTNATFSIWVNLTNTGGPWQRAFDFGTGSTVYMFLSPRIDMNKVMRFAITTNSNTAETQLTAPTPQQTGWHHLVVVIDSKNSNIKLYLDGAVVSDSLTKTVPKDLGFTTQNWLGKSQWPGDEFFNGSLDDLRIYNHALSTNDIIKLYCQPFLPSSQALLKTAREIETILKKQSPKEALAFIEKRIDEYEKQTQTDDTGLAQKALPSELYFLLAEAEKSAGMPKEHVISTYKLAVESGGFLPSRLGSVLLFLYENLNDQEYKNTIVSLIESNNSYLEEIAAQAEAMMAENKTKDAIRFLEANLNPYISWQENHPNRNLASEQTLPEIYFLLAGAKEVTGAPRNEIAEAYSKVLKPSQSYIAPEWTKALIWLEENECNDEYIKAIESFTKDRNTEDCFKNIITRIYSHYESKKDWSKFQLFMDTLFANAQYPSDWALFIESCISDKTSQWSKAYAAYIDSKPGLRLGMDVIIADRYAAEENFEEAAELYKNIINRCEPEDDKAAFELKLCKCLFEKARYQDVINLLDSFIIDYKATHRNLVKEALLMKGRAYIQLAETEKAVDPLLTFIIEYPESNEAPETNFIVGYCYMLQSKFKEATEAFNLLINDYPDSSYVAQAETYLNRIKNMTD